MDYLANLVPTFLADCMSLIRPEFKTGVMGRFLPSTSILEMGGGTLNHGVASFQLTS